MVTKTLAPYPAPLRKHMSSNPTRPPLMPPIPSKRSAPRAMPSGANPERSQRSGSAFASFSFPESRGPLRSQDALLSSTAALIPSAKANKHYVFVYGSLRRGFPHARLMDRATYIGEFRTLARYPLVARSASHAHYLLDIPDKGSRVKGEVYAVDDALLADLDHLEKVGSHNLRKVAKVCSCSDRSFVAQAFVYFGSDELDELVDAKPDSSSRRHHRSEPRYARGYKAGGSSSGR